MSLKNLTHSQLFLSLVGSRVGELKGGLTTLEVTTWHSWPMATPLPPGHLLGNCFLTRKRGLFAGAEISLVGFYCTPQINKHF